MIGLTLFNQRPISFYRSLIQPKLRPRGVRVGAIVILLMSAFLFDFNYCVTLGLLTLKLYLKIHQC